MGIGEEGSIYEAFAKENVSSFQQGVIHEEFKDLPEILFDIDSPDPDTATSLAAQITNVMPDKNPNDKMRPSGPKGQTLESIEKLIVESSGKTGVLYNASHIEDLRSLSKSFGALKGRDVDMYFRGVLRANQLSLMGSLETSLKDLSTIVSNLNATKQSNAEASLEINEKLLRLTQKLDIMQPAIAHTIRTEHALTRSHIPKGQDRGKEVVIYSPQPADAPPGSPKLMLGPENPPITPKDYTPEVDNSNKLNKPPMPSATEIMKMCAVSSCPVEMHAGMGKRYEGKITWEEYNSVMTGALSVRGVDKMLVGWNLRFPLPKKK